MDRVLTKQRASFMQAVCRSDAPCMRNMQRDMQEAAHYFWQAFKFKDSRLLPCNALKSWSVTSTANSKFTTFTTDHTGLVQESTGVQQAESFASIVA